MPNSKNNILEGWDGINWTLVQKNVRKLQKRIYSFSKAGDIQKVRTLQNLLISSGQAKVLAVRRVTQDNQGKKTAGIDGVKSLNPKQRFELAKSLDIPTKAKPLRRVWIPKPGKVEKRPLGIPTMKDRALQALFKMALEPEWESRFEPNSYGFRPGRNCHDAIKAIQFSIQKRAKYVLDADIQKCFDKINHEALLDKIGMTGKFRTQIRYWLESGVLDDHVFSDTEEGTPQGGVISPLLANIALHGLENRIKDYVESVPDKYPSGGSVNIRDRRSAGSVIRYADDFVVMHHSKEIVLQCKEIVKEFLDELGLKLNPEKTRITHTLKLSPIECVEFNAKAPGFNFLGFTIRQYEAKYQSAHTGQGKPLGYKTIIVPSKEKINKHQHNLRDLIGRSRSLPQDLLVEKLNKMGAGWARYFGKSDAYTEGILQKLDYLLYLKLRKWAKSVSKSNSRKATKFWRPVGNRKWVFGSEKGPKLFAYIDYAFSINEYIKVRGEISPYDENDIYWALRLEINPVMGMAQTKLLKAQKGRCTWCHLPFDEDSILEVDHVIPKALGGKDFYTNLQLLHRHCHDAKTRTDGSLQASKNS